MKMKYFLSNWTSAYNIVPMRILKKLTFENQKFLQKQIFIPYAVNEYL